MIQVRLHKLPKAEHTPLPQYQTSGAAGADVHACLPDGPVTVQPGQVVAIPTGLIMEIPPGFEVQIRARSGLALRHGIGLPNGLGTVDSDYRGEVRVLVINWGTEPYTFQDGDRVAQFVVAPVYRAIWEETGEPLNETLRGDGGFGHTGLNEVQQRTGGKSQ